MKRKADRITIANSKTLGDSRSIASLLAPYGVMISQGLAAQIRRYIEILALWNRKVSLTGLSDPEQVLHRHFGEAFFAASQLEITDGRLADVGSGAGFPGLALKLASSMISVSLVESSMKKSAFLAEIVRQLSLEGVEIVTTRFQDFKPRAESYDFVTCRALGGYDELLQWSSRALTPNGRLVLFLGLNAAGRVMATQGWNWRSPLTIPAAKERVILVGTRGQALS